MGESGVTRDPSDGHEDGPVTPRPARRSSLDGSGPQRVVERSAGGIVVRSKDAKLWVLLIRDPYQNWGLPKGHLEAGEGAADAALREVREETGLMVLELGPDLGEIDWTFRRNGQLIHKFCRFYLMASRSGEARPELAEGITECRWLSPVEALRTVTYGNAREVLRRGIDRMRVPPEPGGALWDSE